MPLYLLKSSVLDVCMGSQYVTRMILLLAYITFQKLLIYHMLLVDISLTYQSNA